MSPSAPTSPLRGSPSTIVLLFRNSFRGSYRQLHFRVFWRGPRWTSRRPLRTSFPCSSSDASHSTQPVCTEVITSPHESQRQPANLTCGLIRCLLFISVNLRVREKRLHQSGLSGQLSWVRYSSESHMFTLFLSSTSRTFFGSFLRVANSWRPEFHPRRARRRHVATRV